MVTTISHLQPICIRQEDISALAISSLTHEQNKKNSFKQNHLFYI